jgi:hypothetical protein
MLPTGEAYHENARCPAALSETSKSPPGERAREPECPIQRGEAKDQEVNLVGEAPPEPVAEAAGDECADRHADEPKIWTADFARAWKTCC